MGRVALALVSDLANVFRAELTVLPRPTACPHCCLLVADTPVSPDIHLRHGDFP